jgi:hypothetical protein
MGLGGGKQANAAFCLTAQAENPRFFPRNFFGVTPTFEYAGCGNIRGCCNLRRGIP